MQSAIICRVRNVQKCMFWHAQIWNKGTLDEKKRPNSGPSSVRLNGQKKVPFRDPGPFKGAHIATAQSPATESQKGVQALGWPMVIYHLLTISLKHTSQGYEMVWNGQDRSNMPNLFGPVQVSNVLQHIIAAKKNNLVTIRRWARHEEQQRKDNRQISITSLFLTIHSLFDTLTSLNDSYNDNFPVT